MKELIIAIHQDWFINFDNFGSMKKFAEQYNMSSRQIKILIELGNELRMENDGIRWIKNNNIKKGQDL